MRSCELLLANTQNWARAHLYLGQIEEQSCDTLAACGHYAEVLKVWGHATPKSVTADAARAHARALRCEAK